jgi:hypothetical protein
MTLEEIKTLYKNHFGVDESDHFYKVQFDCDWSSNIIFYGFRYTSSMIGFSVSDPDGTEHRIIYYNRYSGKYLKTDYKE